MVVGDYGGTATEANLQPRAANRKKKRVPSCQNHPRASMDRRRRPCNSLPEKNDHDELIRLENICKTYHLGEVDVPVLRGISLSIDRGEMVALMGAWAPARPP